MVYSCGYGAEQRTSTGVELQGEAGVGNEM